MHGHEPGGGLPPPPTRPTVTFPASTNSYCLVTGHIDVRNLPKFLRRVPSRELNPRPLDRKSDTLIFRKTQGHLHSFRVPTPFDRYRITHSYWQTRVNNMPIVVRWSRTAERWPSNLLITRYWYTKCSNVEDLTLRMGGYWFSARYRIRILDA